MNCRPARLYRIYFVLISVILFGCQESVDPILGEEKPFTLWGYLNPEADTQSVRVFSIEERLGTDRSGPIDAAVTSVNLDTGERQVWKDSLVFFEGAGTGHVFWSPFQARYRHRYRLEVERSDGALSSVEVKVPDPLGPIEVGPATRVQNVTISGSIPNIVGLKVIYNVVPNYPLHPWPEGTPPPPTFILPVEVSYQEKLRRVTGGMEFRVDMEADYPAVVNESARNCLPPEILLRSAEIQFIAVDSAWTPPGGEFDRDILVEPNVMTNVENGYGFFGAGVPFSYTWVPSTSIQDALGYTINPPCPMRAAPECAVAWPCFRCTEALTPEIRNLFCVTAGSR